MKFSQYSWIRSRTIGTAVMAIASAADQIVQERIHQGNFTRSGQPPEAVYWRLRP